MASYDLNGKVALVTGAARGIGFETARQLHLRGASVAVLDLSAEEAREAAERIGARAIGIGADVTDQNAMLAAVAAVVEKFGGLDVAVAKAGVESLGRALRVELAPHGASAGVAYFGWVDTKLVQDAFSQEDSARIKELTPDFLRKRITPAEAGAGLVRGIEERAPRVFVPRWWRYVSALRGLINPLLDRRMESDAKTAALIRDIDAETVDADA